MAEQEPVTVISENGDVHGAIFRYFDWQPFHRTEKPYEILFDMPETQTEIPRCNFSFKPSTVPETVKNVRGREGEFQLDLHGFMLCKHETSFKDWHDREAIKKHYIPEMEEFVRLHVPGADRVMAYDWRIRNSASVFPRVIDLKDPTEALKPATQPHVDCSLEGCRTMIKLHHPTEAEDLLKKQFRLINVWRPLRPVENYPLAYCDSRTVEASDLVAGDRVRREYVGEGLWALPKQNKFKWCYLQDHQPDEVVMLKVSDSREDVAARFCVHAAFSLGRGFEQIDRESLEVRMLVFSE